MSRSTSRIASLLGVSLATLALAMTPAAHADPGSAGGHPASQGKHLGQQKSHGSSGHGSGSHAGHHVRSPYPGKSGQAPGRDHGTPVPGSGSTRAPGQQPTGPGAGDPPGNNGTVKISLLGDHDHTPNNVPHPGCTFEVQWYGYDAGSDVVSIVAFTPQAPTKDVTIGVNGPTQVQVGSDPASGAGTPTGLDAVQDYTLTFSGGAPAKQGYHVRVTVSTPHSLGNDTKTKVFWVSPCTSTPSGGSTTPPGDQGSGTVATPLPGSAVPVRTHQATGGASAGRVVVSDVPTVIEAGISRLGEDAQAHSPWPLVVAGSGAMLAAVGMARMRRRG